MREGWMRRHGSEDGAVEPSDILLPQVPEVSGGLSCGSLLAGAPEKEKGQAQHCSGACKEYVVCEPVLTQG